MKIYQHKYIPRGYNDFLFNHEYLDMINNLMDKSLIFNTIVYGPNGSGKKSIVNYLLNKYFNQDDQIFNLKKIVYTIGENQLYIYKSPYHYEIDSNDNNFNDKKITSDFINEIAKTINISSSLYKVIVIKNSENLSYNAQIVINKLLHLYTNSCRIIFITHNLSKLIGKLRSQCLLLSIKKPTINNIKRILDNIIVNEKIKISNCNLDQIVNNSNNNILSAIFSLQRYDLSNSISVTYIDEFLNEFIEFLFNFKLSKLSLVRENLYLLLLYDININQLFKKIIMKLENDNYPLKKKYNIIRGISYYSYMSIKGYRQIYHYETIIYYIINILKNNNSELQIEHI